MVITNKQKQIEQKIPSLEEALDFNGDAVVYKFMESYEVSFEEGKELFEETKKWLWFANQTDKAFIDKSMLMIDNMWHTFILFTFLYSKYCQEKFGCFLHHSPTTKAEKDKYKVELKNNKKKAMEESYLNSKRQYEAVYDTLGSETLIKWYKVFPEKYSIERINEIRKKVS